MSAPAHNAAFALFIGGILAYGAAFAWYMLDRFDLVNLVCDVNRDDAFYYFQIAWHLAEGKFSTFDCGLTRTNGYHPIWLFLITPFYWVFDKVEALFAIKAFEVMLVAGGVALVAGAARVARLPWVLLFAALPALYRQPALFLGMEAAAALFVLCLFLLAVCTPRRPGRHRARAECGGAVVRRPCSRSGRWAGAGRHGAGSIVPPGSGKGWSPISNAGRMA